MKILAIGNSFSQDATRYLYQIAKSNGDDFTVVNLYIGGCTLEMHYNNLYGDISAYNVQKNGEVTDKYISIKDALLSDNWDIVTLQQGSYESFLYEKFTPYLPTLVNAIKTYAKNAKIYVHQTWAYETDSERIKAVTNYNSSAEMFKDVKYCYDKMKEDINADGLINSGELIELLKTYNTANLYRDGFHMSLGLGRYATALLWYATLSGKGIDGVTFNGFDEPVSLEDIKTVKTAITNLLKG